MPMSDVAFGHFTLVYEGPACSDKAPDIEMAESTLSNCHVDVASGRLSVLHVPRRRFRTSHR
jgi:hypothetical protein